MITRKALKQKGKLSLKKHYMIFAALCLISAFLASEFSGSLIFSTLHNLEELSAGLQDKDLLVSIAQQAGFGSVLATFAAGVQSLAAAPQGETVVLILLGTAGLFAFWFFIQNAFGVILRRIFLEGHTYEKIPISRFLYLLRIKKWLKVSWNMLVRYVYQLLWSLTIIGGILKHYSYFLVPYILAENPDMTANQSVTLSRKLMKGHKWECFLLELSFFGWMIPGILTLGIFNVLFTNPYRTAVFTEYYIQLRQKGKEEKLPLSDLLNDTYLYEKADILDLTEKYVDILDIMETPPLEEPGLPGIRGLLARNFGILLFWGTREKDYEAVLARRTKNKELSDAVKGLVYPTRLFPIPEKEKRVQAESLNYMRQYSIWSLLVIFLGLSVAGWIWEAAVSLVADGELINHGYLNGPWLPIYGSSTLLILTLLYRLRQNPAAEFFAALLLCGFLEYMTSLLMELFNDGMKWWDYSEYLLNLHGRISARGLLLFGVGGMIVVYILAPLMDNFVRKANESAIKILSLLLLLVFCIDFLFSQFHPNQGAGITVPQARHLESADHSLF